MRTSTCHDRFGRINPDLSSFLRSIGTLASMTTTPLFGIIVSISIFVISTRSTLLLAPLHLPSNTTLYCDLCHFRASLCTNMYLFSCAHIFKYTLSCLVGSPFRFCRSEGTLKYCRYTAQINPGTHVHLHLLMLVVPGSADQSLDISHAGIRSLNER